jgi:hypothetical protein
MFATPAVNWTLTVVLLLSGSYHLLQATQSRPPTDRINKSLHALMNLLMAAMLWNAMPSTMLAQITVLAGAALWFLIQAVARPEYKTLCAGRQGRLTCIYQSLTMVGAAFMIAMMAPATISQETRPAATQAMSAPHAHHVMTQAAPGTAGTILNHSPAPAILLTTLFGAAAIVFIILFLRGRATRPAPHNRITPKHSTHTDRAHEALGAALMALMFATMTT